MNEGRKLSSSLQAYGVRDNPLPIPIRSGQLIDCHLKQESPPGITVIPFLQEVFFSFLFF